jgi:hypothetical protein
VQLSGNTTQRRRNTRREQQRTIGEPVERNVGRQKFAYGYDDDDVNVDAADEIFMDVSANDPEAFLDRDTEIDEAFVEKGLDNDDGSESRDVDDNQEEKFLGASHAEDRPPLAELINVNDTSIVTGDVQFLLDFAIVGLPRCGGSRLMRWLRQHEHVQMADRENRSIQNKKPGELVQTLYNFPSGKQYKRGYKNSKDMELVGSLTLLRQHFQKTKLIVGIHHPVLWFQEWYEFKSRIHGQTSLPPAETLVGNNLPHQVRFHVHLSLLGKKSNDGAARQILDMPYAYWSQKFELMGDPLPNQVLIYEARQLTTKGFERRNLLRQDLQRFLELEIELPLWTNETKEIKSDRKLLNICDNKYFDLRTELMEVSMKAYVWLQRRFLDGPGVEVADREHFDKLLSDWVVDPCEASNNTTT